MSTYLAPVVAELSLALVRCLFDVGARGAAGAPPPGEEIPWRLDEGYEVLGPIRTSRLLRLARVALAQEAEETQRFLALRAPQLERMLVESRQRLLDAGISSGVEVTAAGRRRFTFLRTAAVTIQNQAGHPGV